MRISDWSSDVCSSDLLALSRYVVQVAGRALQLSIKTARSTFNSNPVFHDVLMHYVSALHAETLQSVACHGLHPGRVRLARFLLQIQDRTQGSPVMNMTHELLAKDRKSTRLNSSH